MLLQQWQHTSLVTVVVLGVKILGNSKQLSNTLGFLLTRLRPRSFS